jgi:hypothetical protein
LSRQLLAIACPHHLRLFCLLCAVTVIPSKLLDSSLLYSTLLLSRPSNVKRTTASETTTMDFTGQYNFANPQPYHQFMPIPPLTPSHSHSTGSDDFNASPPVSKCPSPRSPPTLPVQPCLSVFLPEHYSINLGLQISKVFGFFTIVPAARLSHTTSASKLTSSLHLHRKTTMPCLLAKTTSSNPSIIQPPKASTPILTSPHPVSLDLRRLRVRTSSLPKFKFTNSKEAR